MGIGALLFASFTSLFSVVNPITAMPVFMALTKEDTEEERKLTALSAFVILRVAPWLNKFIGKSGMTVIPRMMGFIALSIGVQFVINGLGRFFDWV